jgi:hypothetical protein
VLGTYEAARLSDLPPFGEANGVIIARDDASGADSSHVRLSRTPTHGERQAPLSTPPSSTVVRWVPSEMHVNVYSPARLPSSGCSRSA